MIRRVLHNPQTCHFPETGFVYSSAEAFLFADIMWAPRQREVCDQLLWDRWLCVGMNSRLQHSDSWQARPLALFASQLSSNTRTRHQRSVESRTPCCSSGLTACVCSIQSRWIPGIWRWSERKSTCLTGSPFSGQMRWQGRCVLPAVQHPSIHWNSLCCFFCLTLQCRSVHWCHLVSRQLITWPEGHGDEGTGVRVNKLGFSLWRFSGFNVY